MFTAAILFSDAEPFEQIVNIPSTESPMCNLVKIGQEVFREEDTEIWHDFIHVYDPGARAENPRRG